MKSLAVVLATLAGASLALAQPGEVNPRQQRGLAIERMIEGTGDESILQFIETHLAPSYRERLAPGDLLAHLRGIRAACAGFGGVLAGPAGDGATRLRFLEGPRETAVVFRIEEGPPHRIVALELEAERESARAGPEVPPITWATLGPRLDEAAKAGFSGTVLVVRAGEVALHRGYGLANREEGIPNGTDTIFAIGSVPIDFTRAAILKLEEGGKLRTSDPVARFLPGMPGDKRAITIDHLMTGRSGLPDFHHVRGVDEDADLSWIDREEAIRRILGQPLRFQPGEGQAHSHSAWVLLAAIVELASGEAYGDFLRRAFFEPAGMTRTGLHEDAARFDESELAVGYEGQPVGKRNSPRYWGRTSWLVMGSGGMQSTPRDLHRWLEGIRSGRTLSAAAAARYWKGGALVGGDDRGFYCILTEGPGDLVILCSNAHSGPGDLASALGRRLVELVRKP